MVSVRLSFVRHSSVAIRAYVIQPGSCTFCTHLGAVEHRSFAVPAGLVLHEIRGFRGQQISRQEGTCRTELGDDVQT